MVYITVVKVKNKSKTCLFLVEEPLLAAFYMGQGDLF
jgi:hypothetical protein